jgi:hypothetical protein
MFKLILSRIVNERFSYLLSLLIPTFILSFAFMFGRSKGIDLGDLTRDPNTILKGHVYTGMISNAGIFFWSASATICLFTSVFIFKLHGICKSFLLMFFSGLLSFVLGFDDVFQMHEKMFTDIRYIPEELFFITYFICIIFIVIVSYKEFIKTDFVMWLLALFMFFMSLVVDHNYIYVQNDHAFWEDAFKFTGIIIWAVYYLKTSMHLVTESKMRS